MSAMTRLSQASQSKSGPPIDGRLKYAEVLPSDAFENLRMTSMAAETDNPPVLAEAERLMGNEQLDSKHAQNPSTTLRHEAKGTQQPTAVQVSTGSAGTSVPQNCLPHADRLQKYDWARNYLRHLTAGVPKDAADELTAIIKPGNEADEDVTGLSELTITHASKRADYRELSADLYAQYPSPCACQTKVVTPTAR
uniref:Uncharacterized protein n=1 Tax=Anopheles dirus TaxID=7168 RepID=A0A182N0N6_9DIPT